MIETGTPVPAVAVSDAAGDSRPLAAHLERPTIVVFLKSACETTRLALPVFAQWSGLAPEVDILGISQDTPSENGRFFDELGIDLPVVFDPPPYAASAAFDIDAVPAWLFIEDGRVSWSWLGWSAEKAVELNEILGGVAGVDISLNGLDSVPRFRPG